MKYLLNYSLVYINFKIESVHVTQFHSMIVRFTVYCIPSCVELEADGELIGPCTYAVSCKWNVLHGWLIGFAAVSVQFACLSGCSCK